MQIERAWNPIAMTHDPLIVECPSWVSPNQLIKHHGLVFRRPVMCMVNGQFWSRRDWDCLVPAGGQVRFVELPAGGGDSNPLRVIATIGMMFAAAFIPGMLGLTGLAGSLLSAGIMIVGSLLLNMLFPVETPNNDYGTPKTIYSVNSSGNRLRIGEPFCEHFGRFRCFPDLAQVSYTNVLANEQYLYFLGFVGVGEYEIEGVYIDKTPMGDYAEASYNILAPGHIPSIVTNVVWSSSEISGQELSTEWLTAIVSAAGTSALHIEYDLLFPQLIGYNDNGDKRAVSVTVVTQARLVNYKGDGLTAWTDLHSRTYSAASKDPLRNSNKLPVPAGPGRYEFRIRRTVAASEDSKVSDKVSVIGLRAYGGRHPQYGNVTMIEARIRATDQLNGDVASRINVVATRKLLPVTDTGFDSTPAATRSIIDAIAYIVTSENGGMQPDAFLHFDVLNGLKVKLDYSLSHWFDWRFTSRSTVMAACVKAAKCSRSVPYMPGGQLAVARDDYQELPAMVFTDDDYDAGSLSITSTHPTADSPTCVIVRYVDGDTWQDEYVIYYDERGSDLTPFELNLEGCTDRQQAWEMAAYLYKDMMANTINVEFTTGLKGHLPSLFNKLLIAATNVDWGQSGKLAAVEPGLIWLSEPVDFGDEQNGKIFITTRQGLAAGPYAVTKIAGNPYCVAGVIDAPATLQDDDITAMSYYFGPAAVEPLYIRLMGIRPQGMNKVKLFGTIVTDSVYDSPGAVADPGSVLPANDPLESVSISYVGPSGADQQFLASWTGAAVKFKLEVDAGGGFTVLADTYLLYQKQFAVAATAVSLRVTPYSDDTLLTAEAITVSYALVAAPAGLSLDAADADSVDVSWGAVTGANSYDVSIWVDGEDKGGRSVTGTSASMTTAEMAAIGGPWPVFDIHIHAVIGAESGADAILPVSIPVMAAPVGLALQSLLSNGVMLSWAAVSGAKGYKVYVGDTSDFDPDTEGTMVYNGTSPTCLAVVDLTTPYDYYFKVAGTNGYYQAATDLVFSSALDVAAS